MTATTHLDEAYERLRHTGPEFDGGDSNHGPMAVEALSRHGHDGAIGRWVDGYVRRLDSEPRGLVAVTADDWREALGDVRRLGDWPPLFHRELAERPWEAVLARWWPRLVPGIAAAATHGVIRVGHVVRTLREDGVNPVRLAELGQALAYWAARWQPVPGFVPPAGTRSAAGALDAVPLVPARTPGIGSRLAQLPGLPGWRDAVAALRVPDGAEQAAVHLMEVVVAATRRYRTHGHGSYVMMVHAATAPNAVLRVLPSLPAAQWAGSAALGWAASAAITAAYSAPARVEPVASGGSTAEEILDAAVAHGDEHVIKFADTAVDGYAWTGDPAVLDAADLARVGVGA